VLCHADIHTANVLYDGKRFHIVDWDGALLAPKERDLMFTTGAGAGGAVSYDDNQTLFFKGYGEPEIDRMALAYYRCDWVVQDIGEFGHTIFSDAGDETRADNARLVRGMFNPGETVEVAEQSTV
jgi:spectinomycin phosphotransferase